MNQRWIVLLVIGIALAIPSQASAELSPSAQADYTYALNVWEISSPPLCSSVETIMVTDGSLGEDGGWATVPERPNTHCVLMIREGMSPCEQRGIMVHEVGHLSGLRHSEDPNNIMYPEEIGFIFCEAETYFNELAEYGRAIVEKRHELRCSCRHTKGRKHKCRHLRAEINRLRIQASSLVYHKDA